MAKGRRKQKVRCPYCKQMVRLHHVPSGGYLYAGHMYKPESGRQKSVQCPNSRLSANIKSEG